jgi:hypothetical protein
MAVHCKQDVKKDNCIVLVILPVFAGLGTGLGFSFISGGGGGGGVSGTDKWAAAALDILPANVFLTGDLIIIIIIIIIIRLYLSQG